MDHRLIAAVATLVVAVVAGGCTYESPPLAEHESTRRIDIEPPAAEAEPEGVVPWTQWRGPTLDGNTTETAWLEHGAGLRLVKRWEKDVGVGYSAASVDNGRVFTVGYRDGKDTLYCLTADSGEIVWEFSYDANDYDSMNVGGPAGTPSYVDGLVTTVSRDGLVYCLTEDGEKRWAVNLAEKLGVTPPRWGFSGSPIVHGDYVLIDLGVIASLDRQTGAIRWKTEDYGAGYSTPVPFTYQGEACIAAFPALGLVILDEATGAKRARYMWDTSYDVNAATPLIEGDEIFISSGYNTGGALVRFTGSDLEEVWKTKKMRNHMASSVRVGGAIYGIDDGRFACLDAKTGVRLWSDRGVGKGCLIRCGETLIVLADEGELLIGPASRKGFEPTHRFKVFEDGDDCWTAPTLTGGRLYVRSPDGPMACVDLLGE